MEWATTLSIASLFIIKRDINVSLRIITASSDTLRTPLSLVVPDSRFLRRKPTLFSRPFRSCFISWLAFTHYFASTISRYLPWILPRRSELRISLPLDSSLCFPAALYVTGVVAAHCL
jgi:hypothetical protein